MVTEEALAPSEVAAFAAAASRQASIAIVSAAGCAGPDGSAAVGRLATAVAGIVAGKATATGAACSRLLEGRQW